MKKRLCALCLALVLVLSPALAAEGGQFPVLREYQGFDDVATGAWYAPYVQTCYETSLLSGTGGGRFEPQRNVSLGEALVLAARIHYRLHGGTGDLPEAPAPEEFFRQRGETLSDDPDAFAYFSSLYPSAAWNALCYFSGPMEKQGLSFDHLPTEPCYRSELFTLLSIALEGAPLTPLNSVTALPDTRDEAVLDFYRAGILTGVDAYGTFAGRNFLTRAELAATAARIVDPSLRLSFTPLSLDGNYTLSPIDDHGYTLSELRWELNSQWGRRWEAETPQAYSYLLCEDKDGKLGILSREGNVVIAPAYDYIGNFDSDGVARVMRDNRWGFVNLDGREVVPCAYSWAAPIHRGALLVCRTDGSWDTTDSLSNRKPLSRCSADSMLEYATFRPDGTPLAVFPADGRVLDVVYGGVSDGLMAYGKDGQCGYLDLYGSTAIQPRFFQAYAFSGGYAVVTNGLHRPTGWAEDMLPVIGVVDTAGTLTVPFGDYLLAEEFLSESLLPVARTGEGVPQYGAIDPMGQLRIPFDYTGLLPFSQGQAFAARGTQNLLVSADGSAKSVPFAYVGAFSEGCAPFTPDWESWGYLNTDGTPLVPARFSYATPIYRDKAVVKAGDDFFLLTVHS